MSVGLAWKSADKKELFLVIQNYALLFLSWTAFSKWILRNNRYNHNNEFSFLQALVVNNNRLVSLPEEIGKMSTLMKLDVSCNEITHLPVQIGDLTSLKVLNLRRNHLQEIPIGK